MGMLIAKEKIFVEEACVKYFVCNDSLIQRNKNVEIRCTQHVSETTMITHGQGQGQKTGMPNNLNHRKQENQRVQSRGTIRSRWNSNSLTKQYLPYRT
jgi:hypothetical protein